MAGIIIIDDEKHCVDRITSLLSQCKSHFDLILSAQSVEEAIYKVNIHEPDLVFLDVQLGNQTAFDFLSQVHHKKLDIIFTTAYDQYAIEAFKFCALDYLLKPIRMCDFEAAISKYSNNVSRNYFDKKIDFLLKNLKSDLPNKKIAVCSPDGYEFLDLQSIIRFQADGNYTHIFTEDGTKFTVSKTLKVFDEMLNDSNFFRVHNSHLINMHRVKRYYKGKGGYIIMDDNSSINVSFRKREGFFKIITENY